jgi:quinol monooxygenase YgiN
MSEQVFILIHGKTKPGMRPKLFEAFNKFLVPKAETNSKQVLVSWCEDLQDQDKFHLVECYESMAAFQANSTLPEFGQYMQEAQTLLAEQPSFSMAKPKWTKGLK